MLYWFLVDHLEPRASTLQSNYWVSLTRPYAQESTLAADRAPKACRLRNCTTTSLSRKPTRPSHPTQIPSTAEIDLWSLRLHFQAQCLTFSHLRASYLQRPGSRNEKIYAFPKGLQMVAGKAGRRTYNASNFEDQAVSFVCLDYYNDHSSDPAWRERPNFFEHNCPNGMRAQVFFPSCVRKLTFPETNWFTDGPLPQQWDGKNLYKPDQSHMAYPIETHQGGNCPSSHPVHLISLFYEWYIFVALLLLNATMLITEVFSSGSFRSATSRSTRRARRHGCLPMATRLATAFTPILPWGASHEVGPQLRNILTYRVELTGRWPTGPNSVLQQAIDTCGLETGGDVNACAVFRPHMDNDSAAACKPEGQIVDEPNGWKAPLTKLPGDNPMWSGLGTVKVRR